MGTKTRKERQTDRKRERKEEKKQQGGRIILKLSRPSFGGPFFLIAGR